MNRVFASFVAAFALLLCGHGAAWAQAGARVVERVSWVEEWDPASRQWVRIEDHPASTAPTAFAPVINAVRAGPLVITDTATEEPMRFIARPMRAAAAAQGLARFGPFRVLDSKRAALEGSTDAASPRAFAAMLAAYPALEVIEFVDAPGTTNDLANLALGRAIRAAGLATHVPEGGSARSGAVELFLAGVRRTMDPRALFAVHSWRDAVGREPADFAPDAPENRLYLDYYAEMGMGAAEARAFYAMTNSAPHAGALWLRGSEMARWIAPGDAAPRPPAARSLPPRRVLARAHATSQRLPLRAPRIAPRIAPQLAYADLDALTLALLDSRAAFP